MSIKTAERNSGILPEDNVIHHRHLIAYYEAEKHIREMFLKSAAVKAMDLKYLHRKPKPMSLWTNTKLPWSWGFPMSSFCR